MVGSVCDLCQNFTGEFVLIDQSLLYPSGFKPWKDLLIFSSAGMYSTFQHYERQ